MLNNSFRIQTVVFLFTFFSLEKMYNTYINQVPNTFSGPDHLNYLIDQKIEIKKIDFQIDRLILVFHLNCEINLNNLTYQFLYFDWSNYKWIFYSSKIDHFILRLIYSKSKLYDWMKNIDQRKTDWSIISIDRIWSGSLNTIMNL